MDGLLRCIHKSYKAVSICRFEKDNNAYGTLLSVLVCFSLVFAVPTSFSRVVSLAIFNQSFIFFSGFAGHVPYGFQRFGESSKKLTNSALCDFSSNYRRRQSTEWAPVNVVKLVFSIILFICKISNISCHVITFKYRFSS